MPLNTQARQKIWLPVRNANCKQCDLYKEANTVCLMGDGPVPADLMIVGEAPGAREDDVERPFSGVAGQYLDRMLKEVGLSRDNIYITNAVRCRPPDNRTPTKTEIKACSNYMVKELEIVNPRFVLTLGNTALQALTGKTGIMLKHGVKQVVGGRIVLPTVHPAAVLRNPAHEGIFRADLLSLTRLMAGTDSRPETHSALIKSSKGLSKLCSMLAAVEGPISFDVETGTKDMLRDEGGLQPWAPDGVIHTVSFTWEEGRSFVVALEHPDVNWDIPIERVYEALNVALAGKKMIGHNIKFDVQWMRRKGVDLYAHFDTKAAAHLLDENRPTGLKPLARAYLGADDYEAGISFTSVTPLPKLAIYNGKDTDYTHRLYHIFKEELKKQPRLARLFLTILMPGTRAFADFEMNGFPVDVARLRERHIEIKKQIEETKDKLLEYVPEEKKAIANFASPVFMGWFLYDHLKLPVLLLTPKGARSTAEAVLLQLRRKHPAANLIMELRKYQKYESTYTRNWLTRVGIARKPRLYTSYNLTGTVTGRLSSNMQQVPRDLYIRTILGTRPGWRFVEADFSQIELRIAAMFSGDKALTKTFIEGGDPHATTAWTVDRNATFRATELLRLWAGVSANRSGAQVLSELLGQKKRITADQTLEVYLRSCGSFWQDTKSRGRIRRQSEGSAEPDVAGWDFSAAVPEALKSILRAMRQYEVSTGTPFGSQSQKQPSFEFRDALQILSSTPPSQREELFPDWKEHRKKAKAVAFGFLYGMWWKKFRKYADEKYDVQVTDEEAKHFREAFFELYGGLPAWHQRQRRIVRNLQQVQSPTGRVRHLPTILSVDEGVQQEAERQAINSPVQGFASDLTVLAMIILHGKLDRREARLIGNVHDSIVLEVKEERVTEIVALVKNTMEHLPLKKLFGYTFSIPIEAEVSVGSHWGEP